MRDQSDWTTLVAGATAGFVVDTSLFPIDTIKSRLQSQAGLLKSGGFSNLYRGLTPVLIASVPCAAGFFLTYENIKHQLEEQKVFGQFVAASAGETVACAIRVPYDIIKVRLQTSKDLGGSLAIARSIMIDEGFAGFFRGFSSTVMRDVPFSAIQYPIWEYLKRKHLERNQKPAGAHESAFYGSMAGAISAFLTTPLDVAKTRIMLAEPHEKLASGSIPTALKVIYLEKGIVGLFAGVVPRMAWISIGAAIFLGSYETVIEYLK